MFETLIITIIGGIKSLFNISPLSGVVLTFILHLTLKHPSETYWTLTAVENKTELIGTCTKNTLFAGVRFK